MRAVMCAALERGVPVEPLALMKSAGRLPIGATRFCAPSALRVLPFPGARPVRHHLPSTFPAPGAEGLGPLEGVLAYAAPWRGAAEKLRRGRAGNKASFKAFSKSSSTRPAPLAAIKSRGEQALAQACKMRGLPIAATFAGWLLCER